MTVHTIKLSSRDNAHLDELIKEPRETLDVEVKEWLDLADNDHRAGIAKETIALANHGGGYIVVGFKEMDDGTFRSAEPHPKNRHCPGSLNKLGL